MSKTLIKQFIMKMSSKRQIKETFSKKLVGKKIPTKIESNGDQAENVSPFFKEIKNKGKSANNVKNKAKEIEVKLENANALASTKSELIRNNNNIKPVNQESRSSRNLKTEDINDTKSFEKILKNQKSSKASISTNKKKVSTEEAEEPSTSKKIKESLEEEKWQPTNWKIMLENMRNMRSKSEALVDSMGCHKCADENADEKTQRYHKLIALMLSSQTKDETTYQAMLRLKEHNLTPEIICNMKLNVLENILHPVSFYKDKAKYIQKTSQILVEKYNSDIPNNIKELVALPGVGPKMAHICMATAWHEVTGIGVDVHVHRISNRIGWLPKPTKEPEKTRLGLEAWVPQHLWGEVNHLLVGFGQTICTPVKPKCNECLNFEICPSASKIIKKRSLIKC